MRRVTSGQPIVHSAQEFNLMAAAAEWVQRNGNAFNKFKAGIDTKPHLVRVYNGSGAAVGAHEPLGIDGPYIAPADNAMEFSYNLTLTCDTLDEDYEDAIAISAEPIANGKFGKAYISGFCIAYVNINSASDWYATAGVDTLESASSGCISILWRNGTSGSQLCLIRLGNPTVSTGIFPASITGESSGSYAWSEQKVDNTTGAFSALTGGRSGTTSVNPAKEFNGIVGLYNASVTINSASVTVGASKAFVVQMHELTSADGTKFYKFYSPFPPFALNKFQIATYNIGAGTVGTAVVEYARFE